MAGILRWLATPRARAPVAPAKAHPDLAPLDVAGVLRELDLAAEGVRLGRLGVPAPDAVTPSGPETAAIQRVEKARQDYVDWAVLRLGVIDTGLAGCDVTADVARARRADEAFVHRASALIAERQAVLDACADAARRGQAELEAFRDRHRLARDARVPDAWGRAWRASVVLFLAVVEGVLNAGFFAQGLDSGLLGGAFHAMGLALLNVGLAYVLGRWCVRYMNHVAPPLRLAGFAALAIAVGAMGGMALAIAHVRDALTAGLPDAGAQALRTLAAQPFALRDPMSWGLALVSLAFGVVALVDGYRSDDPYPGFGAVAARAREARADWEDELEALREDLEAAKAQALHELDEAARRAQATLAARAGYLQDRVATRSRLLTALRDADHALAAVLAAFRTENEAARGALPRPAYFDRPPVLAPLALPDLETTAHEAALAAQRALVEAMLPEVESVRARILSAYLRTADALTPLGEHFGGPPRHGAAPPPAAATGATADDGAPAGAGAPGPAVAGRGAEVA